MITELPIIALEIALADMRMRYRAIEPHAGNGPGLSRHRYIAAVDAAQKRWEELRRSVRELPDIARMSPLDMHKALQREWEIRLERHSTRRKLSQLRKETRERIFKGEYEAVVREREHLTSEEDHLAKMLGIWASPRRTALSILDEAHTARSRRRGGNRPSTFDTHPRF